MKKKKRKDYKGRFLVRKWQYYLFYTLTWLLGALVLVSLFRKYGYTFIWVPDGAYQHFSAFNYVCEMAESLLGGQFVFSDFGPFNYTIGQGGDLFTTLNSYDLTDPVSWLCAFVVPLERTVRYTLMIFVKLWLAGIAFSVYCFATDNEDRLAVMCGALSYAFSGAIVFMAPRHPNYINWAYFLPLLLAGYELFRRKKRTAPLIIFVFLNLMTSYYTFYMNAVLLVIYVTINVIAEGLENKSFSVFKEEFITACKTAGLCLAGIILSSWMLLPTVYAFSQNARLGLVTGYVESSWHWPVTFYKKWLVTIFDPVHSGGYSSVLGILPVSLLAIPGLYLLKKHLNLKINLFLSFALLGIPVFGRLMNGFGYASNRWAYAFCFYAAVAVAVVIPRLHEMSKIRQCLVLLFGLGYILACIYFRDLFTGTAAALAPLAVTLAVFAVSSFSRERVYRVLIACLAVAGIYYELCLMFTPSHEAFIKEFVKSKKLATFFDKSSSQAAALNDPEAFYRVDTMELDLNLDEMNGVHGTDIWWSVIPSSLQEYLYDLELSDLDHNCKFEGLDGRSGLLALASVKYYTVNNKKSTFSPYGYELLEQDPDTPYRVYKNTMFLPLGYTFKNYIRTEDYDELSELKKQDVLLQAVVLDHDEEELGTKWKAARMLHLDYEITEQNNVEIKKKRWKVLEEDGSATLTAELPEGYEIYLWLAGPEIKTPSTVLITVIREDGSVDYEDEVIEYEDENAGLEYGYSEYGTRSVEPDSGNAGSEDSNAEIENADSGYYVRKRSRLSNEQYYWPVLTDGILFNLGAGKGEKSRIEIQFSEKAKIDFRSVKIIAMPTKGYEKKIAALSEYTLENISVDGKQITGTISLPETRFLQLAVPYHEGWTAYVDGVKTDLVKSDKMYMGMLLHQGEHTIELHYHTPLFREGVLVTLAGLVCWGAAAVYVRIRKRKKTI